MRKKDSEGERSAVLSYKDIERLAIQSRNLSELLKVLPGVTSGRDLLLSGTTILHRAFLRSGDDARLIVFEGLPHAFWNDISLPETKEAYGQMASFFEQQLLR
jgi:acetyl esterase/lipase